jgi:hypothetical protein
VIHQLVLCCQHVVMVHCLFFNFVVSFDFGCCSLAQGMSPVVCPNSGSGLSSARCWPFCISSLCLLKVHAVISFLLLPSFSGVLWATLSLCYVLVFSSLFIVQFWFFFLQVGVCLPRGLCWFIPGVSGENHMMLGAHLLVCRMSPKQVWSQCLAAWQPICFLSVMWCGEVFHRLGV